MQFLLSCWLRQCWSIWRANILYFSFLFRKNWASQTSFFGRTNVYWRKAYVPDSVKKKLLMERSGFSLLCSTLDYMHHFFNLYVIKKYNQYFFQLILESKFSSFKYSISLILKILLSYSDQAQQPLKRKKKKNLARSKTALKLWYQNCTRSQWKDWMQTLIKFI